MVAGSLFLCLDWRNPKDTPHSWGTLLVDNHSWSFWFSSMLPRREPGRGWERGCWWVRSDSSPRRELTPSLVCTTPFRHVCRMHQQNRPPSCSPDRTGVRGARLDRLVWASTGEAKNPLAVALRVGLKPGSDPGFGLFGGSAESFAAVSRHCRATAWGDGRLFTGICPELF